MNDNRWDTVSAAIKYQLISNMFRNSVIMCSQHSQVNHVILCPSIVFNIRHECLNILQVSVGSIKAKQE